MKLPNGGRAVVDRAKLTEYCLNPDHFRGRHKARVFAAALGIGFADADWLPNQLLQAARGRHDAAEAETDAFGRRFVLDFPVARGEAKATVPSRWIIRRG